MGFLYPEPPSRMYTIPPTKTTNPSKNDDKTAVGDMSQGDSRHLHKKLPSVQVPVIISSAKNVVQPRAPAVDITEAAGQIPICETGGTGKQQLHRKSRGSQKKQAYQAKKFATRYT